MVESNNSKLSDRHRQEAVEAATLQRLAEQAQRAAAQAVEAAERR